MQMITFNTELNTSGDGYWSRHRCCVRTTKLELAYENKEGDFGELRVYFDTTGWNPEQHGLIYTDTLFLQELRTELSKIELDGDDVDYSEQGMQGDNYVSCDVGAKFINSWRRKLAAA